MASLLRQIVAGPRAKHTETGLDMCYVTPDIIVTSGPSQNYPQRAYRNPLDRVVAFLDSKHKDNWAIWEFRAEGTGYPDEAVYHRIRHYPWPDHHPPPFGLVPIVMAGMRNWHNGGALEGGQGDENPLDMQDSEQAAQQNGRVIVVHCKAGKGRSGTMTCSYLISQRGWTMDEALARFTERRMRPDMGRAGVSIPSQLRWVRYVDRWTKGGKVYADRDVEIVEIHAWGLRHGVKVGVEGFLENGKKIHTFHTFKAAERNVIESDAPGGGSVKELVVDMATTARSPPPEKAKTSGPDDMSAMKKSSTTLPPESPPESSLDVPSLKTKSKTAQPGQTPSLIPTDQVDAKGPQIASAQSSSSWATKFSASDEPGGQAVIFKPSTPIRIPKGDVNITIERRTRAPASLGLTMVTAVAHVWFNTFFEGNGPEQNGIPDDSGVFEIEWDKMDGIKGSSQKGTRAVDRIAVVWRVPIADMPAQDRPDAHSQPTGSQIPQMDAADWRGGNDEDPNAKKKLGLRAEEPDSAEVSKASSVRSLGKAQDPSVDDDAVEEVRTSGPNGEALVSEGKEVPKSS